MAIYYCKPKAPNAISTSGPYTFRHGLIETTEANDKVVGRILKQYYGGIEVNNEMAQKVLEKYGAGKEVKADTVGEGEDPNLGKM